MRHISEQGIALIAEFEGFSSVPYRCPAGVMTIGYGHAIGAGEIFPAEGITKGQAQELLRQDARKAEQAVGRLIAAALSPNQYAALVSFTYNVGAGALQRSGLRRKVNRMEHADIQIEFMKWVWAGDRRLPGLIRRRAAEALLYGKQG